MKKSIKNRTPASSVAFNLRRMIRPSSAIGRHYANVALLMMGLLTAGFADGVVAAAIPPFSNRRKRKASRNFA
jgi:hypothetical protein